MFGLAARVLGGSGILWGESDSSGLGGIEIERGRDPVPLQMWCLVDMAGSLPYRL